MISSRPQSKKDQVAYKVKRIRLASDLRNQHTKQGKNKTVFLENSMRGNVNQGFYNQANYLSDKRT